MSLESLHDRSELRTFFRRDPGLHVYGLGDLDPFFWPHTQWFGWRDDGELRAVVLVYLGQRPPTVVGLDARNDALRALVDDMRSVLPRRFHAHFSPGVAEVLRDVADRVDRGEYLRMVLTDVTRLPGCADPDVRTLTRTDLPAIRDLYAAAYPDTWFDPRMLDTGFYRGLDRDGTLVSISGIHVVSHEDGVAALGNIATHPDHRARGYGTRTTGALCRDLRKVAPMIGLNVHGTNGAARTAYERLGFTEHARYEEMTLTLVG